MKRSCSPKGELGHLVQLGSESPAHNGDVSVQVQRCPLRKQSTSSSHPMVERSKNRSYAGDAAVSGKRLRLLLTSRVVSTANHRHRTSMSDARTVVRLTGSPALWRQRPTKSPFHEYPRGLRHMGRAWLGVRLRSTPASSRPLPPYASMHRSYAREAQKWLSQHRR